MPLPQIKITQWKDGRQVARFRDAQGLVRTRVGPVNWTRAEQVKQLANYGIALQVAQARAGIGSDGQRMPPLKGGIGAQFASDLTRITGRTIRSGRTYADWKVRHGLQPLRDLYGAGVGGHMLDDIRISYLDDSRATIAITTQLSRQKALSNEKKAPWWGWSDASIAKMTALAHRLFQLSVAEELYYLGLIGDNALAQVRLVAARAA